MKTTLVLNMASKTEINEMHEELEELEFVRRLRFET